MKEDLFPYYEAELRFMQEMSREFGKDHSKVAGRLGMEGDRCSDPHVERLIQAFALIAGRIRHKIDDQFPEITEALLNILYPHYVRPIPSLAIAQLELDPTQGKPSGKQIVPAKSGLSTRRVAGAGVSCLFQTCYPVTLWPLRVVSAQVLSPAALNTATQTYDASAVIRLTLQCHGDLTAAAIDLSTVRFFLNGDGDLPYTLHELILNSTREVLLSASEQDEVVIGPYRFPSGALRPVGFDRNEGIFPYPAASFLGYRLLTEYFAFPEKFLFFDLDFQGLPLAELGGKFEITFIIGKFERKERLRKLERVVRAEAFQLGCTPIINLFDRPARPITVTHKETEYHVLPDVNSHLAAEVYAIRKVTSMASYRAESREYHPFYGLRHVYDESAPEAFWFASRRLSSRKDSPRASPASPPVVDRGTEVYLSLVDTQFHPAQAGTEALSVHATWTNRDLPAQLPLTQEFGDLTLDASGSVRARCLTRLTESLRPPLRSGLQWRLISHLALNHLSLTDITANALREILTLYNFSGHPMTANQIVGILSVSSRPHMARMPTPAGIAFALGIRVQIEFDEDRYADNGVYLMSAVLERFLGLYSSINSFTQLTTVTRQRKEPLRAWKPRAGEQILL